MEHEHNDARPGTPGGIYSVACLLILAGVFSLSVPLWIRADRIALAAAPGAVVALAAGFGLPYLRRWAWWLAAVMYSSAALVSLFQGGSQLLLNRPVSISPTLMFLGAMLLVQVLILAYLSAPHVRQAFAVPLSFRMVGTLLGLGVAWSIFQAVWAAFAIGVV